MKMKFNKYIIIFLILLICFPTGCKQKQLDNTSTMPDTNPTTDTPIQNPEKNQEISNDPQEIIIKKEDIPSSKEEINQPVNTYTITEQEMISTFEKIEDEADILLQSNESGIQDKLKGIFITMVDFIFYDGEINGITFQELGEDAQQQVLKITASIDSKIENKFPNYKETISSKTKKAFNAIGDMIHKGANNIKEFSKEKLGEENYNSLINAKDELVYYTKNAFHTLGNVASGIWNSTESLRDKASDALKNGKDKVKDWYENLKNGD